MTRTFLLASIGATLLGCSSVETPCSSRLCISQRAQQPIIRECVRDLHVYALHQAHREAINRKYQYPLTNASTYATLSRMGAIGPSPWDWCEAYAARQARVVIPQTTFSDRRLN
ncbi:MAG: hypothetical protein RIC56_10820 [Pseudomonadales bacterium]